MATVIEHLEDLLRSRTASLQPTAGEPILSALATIGRLLSTIASAAPSKGYEPWLCSKGLSLISARGLAMLVRRHAERVEEDERQEVTARRALRQLTSGQIGALSKRRRLEELLRISKETCVLDAMLDPCGMEASEFVTLLKAEQGRLGACDSRLVAVIRLMLSHPLKRGTRRAVSSIAHEFLLENILQEVGGATYSYDQKTNSCTDAASEATRREFGLGRFDARPAARRRKGIATQRSGNLL